VSGLPEKKRCTVWRTTKFKQKMSNAPTNKYDYVANPIVNKMFDQKIKTGASDINSSLREAEEAINKAIAAGKAN